MFILPKGESGTSTREIKNIDEAKNSARSKQLSSGIDPHFVNSQKN